MAKIAVPIVVGLIVLIVGIYLINSLSPTDSIGVTGDVVDEDYNENTENNVEDIGQGSETKTFVLTGENFKFVMNGVDNPEIRIKQGNKVRIEFTSTDGFHDWVVDEFNAATERVSTNASTFVEFTADKKGTFEYYCSVGKHREIGMKGNLVVE